MKSNRTMFKRLISLVLAGALVISAPIAAAAAVDTAPLRAHFEEQSSRVDWYEASQQITITIAQEQSLRFYVGASYMYINDEVVHLNHPITLYAGRTFIHLDDIAVIEERLIHVVVAELQNDETAAVAAAGPQIHGFLHRAVYGDNVAYLFGSLHGMRDHWTPLADIVEEAMRRADVFAFEIDLDDMLNPELLMPIMERAMFLPNDQTLAEFLPEDVYENFVYHLPSFGIEYELVYNWNPVFLASTIEMAVVRPLLELDSDPDASIDVYVWDFAGERGLPRIGLEPIMQQLEIVFLPPYEVMQEALRYFVSLEELLELVLEYEGESLELANLYEANDKARIIALFAELDEAIHESASVRHMIEMTMNYRSNYYARRIAGLLRETAEPTTFFVTVGASHIIRTSPYQYNIVNFLEDMGFDVEALF